MKPTTTFLAFILLACIFSAGFQCGDRFNEPCTTYTRDTVLVPFVVANNSSSLHIGDSVTISSVVNDVLKKTDSTTVTIELIDPLNANIVIYKVVGSAGNYNLEYANTDFDPRLSTGNFQPAYGTGISLLYNRNQPNNILEFTEKAGRVGLYLIQLNSTTNYGAYNNFYDKSNPCNSHTPQVNIPLAQRQLIYWDQLGVTALRLSPSSYPAINKTDPNYIFVKVLP